MIYSVNTLQLECDGSIDGFFVSSILLPPLSYFCLACISQQFSRHFFQPFSFKSLAICPRRAVSLARPQGIDVLPANGHGRPAKRHAREDLWDRRLCYELCPWFRSRVLASVKSVCFCRLIPLEIRFEMPEILI